MKIPAILAAASLALAFGVAPAGASSSSRLVVEIRDVPADMADARVDQIVSRTKPRIHMVLYGEGTTTTNQASLTVRQTLRGARVVVKDDKDPSGSMTAEFDVPRDLGYDAVEIGGYRSAPSVPSVIVLAHLERPGA